MNNSIKKQTNLGIVLAIVGFAMVGGALVLVPRLVDEKIRSMQTLNIAGSDDRVTGKTVAPEKSVDDPARPASENRRNSAVKNGGAHHPDDMAETDEDTVAGPEGNAGKNAGKNDGAADDRGADNTAANGDNAAAADATIDDGDNVWTLILDRKYEPDAASSPKLQEVIALVKSSPQTRLRIVGMNNINKMSKLAQIGATKIAGVISRDADIPIERMETAIEQQSDLKDVRVKIIVLGGAQ